MGTRLSIRLKLALILAAAALGMIGCIGAFAFLLRSSQNTLAQINAESKSQFESAFGAIQQAATIQDLTLKLVREKDLDNIESLMKRSQEATGALGKQLESGGKGGPVVAAFTAFARANDHVRESVMVAEGATAHSRFIDESTPAYQALLDAIQQQQQQSRIQREEESARAAASLQATARVVMAGVVVLLVIIVLLGGLMARNISRSLGRIVDKVRVVAGGDLRVSLDEGEGGSLTNGADDEISDLYRAFNDMLTNLRDLQGRVAAAFHELESAIGDVSAVAAGLQTGADKQSQSVDEIAAFISRVNEQAGGVVRSMESQASKSEETSTSIMEMIASIEEVSRNADSLSASVEDTGSSVIEVLNSNKEVSRNVEALNMLISKASVGVAQIDKSIKEVESLAQDSQHISNEVKDDAEKEGSVVIQAAIGEMTRIRTAVVALSETVSRLSASVGNIGDILVVIDHVTTQTNLLALNAAIIAAQAGEHGRSFAVVADEIRELAERTTSSTQEISRVISGIQTETGNVKALVREGIERVDVGVQSVNRTDQALKHIIASADRALLMSSRMAHATSEQAAGSREVARSIQDVLDLSTEISRATVQQAQGSETIIRAVESMRELAEHVRRAMGEQTGTVKVISRASIDSNHLTQEVSKASQESKQLVERAVSEASSIRTAARETLTFVSRMKQIVESFDALAGHLKKTLSQFQTR